MEFTLERVPLTKWQCCVGRGGLPAGEAVLGEDMAGPCALPIRPQLKEVFQTPEEGSSGSGQRPVSFPMSTMPQCPVEATGLPIRNQRSTPRGGTAGGPVTVLTIKIGTSILPCYVCH